MQGESLGRHLRGEKLRARTSPRPIPLELAADNIQPPRRGVVVGDYKLVRYGAGKGYKHHLFNLKSDPGERRDLSKTEPQTLARMQMTLDKTFDRFDTIAPYGGMKLKGGGRASGSKGPTVAAR